MEDGDEDNKVIDFSKLGALAILDFEKLSGNLGF